MGLPEARKEIGRIFRFYLELRSINQTQVIALLKEQFPDVARSEAHISQVKNGKGAASIDLLDALDVVLATEESMGDVLREASRIGPPKIYTTNKKGGGQGFAATVVSLTSTAVDCLSVGSGPVSSPLVGPFRHFQPTHIGRNGPSMVFGFEFGVNVTARWHRKRLFRDVGELAGWAHDHSETYWHHATGNVGSPLVGGDPFYCVFIANGSHAMNNDRLQASVRLAATLPHITQRESEVHDCDLDVTGTVDLTQPYPDKVYGAARFACPRLSYGYATSDGLAYYKQCRKHALPVREVVAAAATVRAAVDFTRHVRSKSFFRDPSSHVIALRKIDLALKTRVEGRHMQRYRKCVTALYESSQISRRVNNGIEHIEIYSHMGQQK